MASGNNSPGRSGSGGGGGPAASPQLGRRVAIMGFIAAALLAVVFFRLWFLQVLSGNDYVQQARENRVRIVSLPAPRGQITDRTGKTLVAAFDYLQIRKFIQTEFKGSVIPGF